MRFTFVLVLLAALSLPVAKSAPAAEPADISGKWHFVMETEGGERTNEADFKLAGDQVSGKFASADVKGTFKDGALDLAFPFTSDEAGMTATFKLKGQLKEGKLTGDWQFGDYNGSYTASRATDKTAAH